MDLEDSRDTPPAQPGFLATAVAQKTIFYHNPPLSDDGLAVVCAGREKATPQYHIKRSNFPHYGIEWVSGGSGTLTLNGNMHPLRRGAFFLYGPDIPHEIRTNPEDCLRKSFVDFEGPLADKLIRKHHLDRPAFRQLDPQSDIETLFNQLIRTGASNTPQAPRLCRLLLESLVLLAADTNEQPDTEPSRAYQSYLKCQEYLETHYSQIKRMDAVAKACHIDAAYMTRLFRRFADKPPHTVLLEIKMRHAALTLRRHNVLVKAVASELGYADSYHFSKDFKKVHGMPPTHYQQAYQS